MHRSHFFVCAGAVALLACAGWSTARCDEKPTPNELPRAWSLEEIAKATPPYGAEGHVHVLAWKVVTDARPWRVESCLVFKVLDKKEGYCLAHLYRHPTAKKPEWHLASTHVVGEKGTPVFTGLEFFHSHRFKEQPGNKELYAVLGFKGVNWRFELESGWKYISCCVCEETWQAVIGEKPTQFFDVGEKAPQAP
jgi:hypothetical protein